jgi:hypothetical protein
MKVIAVDVRYRAAMFSPTSCLRMLPIAALISSGWPASRAFAQGAAGQKAASEKNANQLTTTEKKEGWQLLFDGKAIDQWRGYQKKDMTGLRWAAKDGCLDLPSSDGHDTKGARDIVSTTEYDDFELTWEWRIAPGGNSGVKYFVSEDRPAALGHEYQTIDDDKHPDAKVKDSRRTASFYDVLPAPTARPRAVGEFNQSRIVVKGNHVEHWLNGARVLAYELDSPPLRTAIAASKFKSVEGFDKHKRGHILLQDHGDGICYRNLKIRPLPAK